MNYRIGAISQTLTPGYSYCEKCGTTWAFVNPHTTNYSECMGCFALCSKCWKELSPKQRLPYYEQMFLKWTNPDIETLKVIRNNVLKGL